MADELLARQLREELGPDEVEVVFAPSGAAGLGTSLDRSVVFTLRAPLPDMTPSEFLRRLRERSDEPLVLVVGDSLDEIDRIVAFELGADDLVALPTHIREIALRVRALLRRSPGPSAPPERVRAGRLEMDVPSHRVTVDGEPVGLTAMEFRLLAHLAQNAGVVMSRPRLIAEVWKHPGDLDPRTVDTHVKRLREKLGDAADALETVRGFGYRFRDRPRDETDAVSTQASRSTTHSVPG